MAKRISILIVIFIFCTRIYSQEKNLNYSIEISEGSGPGNKWSNIYIQKNNRVLKIVYQKEIKVKYNRIKKDKNYRRLLDTLEMNHSLSKSSLQELHELIKNHTRFRNAEISVPFYSNEGFFNLLDTVYNSDIKTIQDDIRSGYFLILDGTTVNIIIRSSGMIQKEAWVNSPTYESHPLVYRLINDSFKLYEKIKRKPFI